MSTLDFLERLAADFSESHGVGIKHEQIGLGLQNNAVGLLQSRGEIDLRRRSGFLQGGSDLLLNREIGFEDENASALFSGRRGIGRRRFVHNRNGRGANAGLVRRLP